MKEKEGKDKGELKGNLQFLGIPVIPSPDSPPGEAYVMTRRKTERGYDYVVQKIINIGTDPTILTPEKKKALEELFGEMLEEIIDFHDFNGFPPPDKYRKRFQEIMVGIE